MTFLLCDVVFAGCKHVSEPREYDGILFYKLYLFVVCIENIVLQLCKTRYDGESKCCQIKTRQTESLLWARNL